MTERKPRGMSFTSWIDQQIADAEERGVFDNLPGAGQPLNLKPQGDADYGQAWIHDYARREGVTPEEFLPTPLRLRREIERLAEAIEGLGSEDEVREVVGDLNRRILEWRRIPVGPPVFVPLVHMDDMLDRWRAAQAGKQPRTPKDVTGNFAKQCAQSTHPAPSRWWRRLPPAKRTDRA